MDVKCSLCGKTTFCEKCKEEGSFEHVCFECYQKGQTKENAHICIPQEKVNEAYDKFMSNVINSAFSELWNAEKKRLKELSKQEISKVSFHEGARFMLGFMRRVSEESEKQK